MPFVYKYEFQITSASLAERISNISGSSGGTTPTGSLLLTSSFSNPNLTFTKGNGSTFSVNLNTLVPTSSSYALSSSFALSASFSPTNTTGSFTGSFTGSVLGTASYANHALTSSFALSASFAPINTTGSFTGSFTGSVLGTASFATRALSSSFSSTSSIATSSSFATTASFATTSSFATTASFALNVGGGGGFRPYSLTVQYPIATENITFFYASSSVIVLEVEDVVRGTSPSITYNISFAPTRNSGTPTNLFSTNRTTTSITGASTTVFASNTIPANSWVWLTTSAASSGITEAAITLIT
jgi:hypothetical protein